MTESELSDSLMGLFAYDIGCRDSGIHDERLRERVRVELFTDPGRNKSQIVSNRISRIVRDAFLSDEAIADGYGLEDVAEFIKWLDEEMGIEF